MYKPKTTRTKVRKHKDNHYVNDEEFYDEMVEWIDKVNIAKANGEPHPPLTESIGEKIWLIVNGRASAPNFSGYTWKYLMIGDAIENCIQYIKNFNEEKSSNAFAYVTQICYYAFLRRIQKEKKQVFIKQQATDAAGVTMDAFTTIDGNHDATLINTNVEWMQENMNRVEYEPRKSKKVKKTTIEKGLDKFTE